jgi:DNA-binding transcriptional MerR regulator
MVQRLLKVKAHVIRYWEKEVPLIQPERDEYGRRVYGERDLQIFLRLKHLLYERRFTLEGAKMQLYAELSGELSGENTGAQHDFHASVSQVRAELLKVFSLVRKNSPAANDDDTSEADEK